MWTVLLAATLLVPQGGGRGGAVGGGGVRPALELTLAAPVDLPDGRRIGATAVVSPGPEPWFVYSGATLCESAIVRGGAPTDASEAWRVTVVERGRANTQLTAAVSWARIVERGRATSSGSAGTSEITLHVGDRIPLDRILRPALATECAATQKSLELRLGYRLPVGSATSDGVPAVIDADPPTPVAAELWMVHVVPGQPELVERQTVRLGPGGIGFQFRGQPVESPVGAVVLELSGVLRAVARPDGTLGLWAGLTRSVTSHLTGRTYSTTGTGEKTSHWLAPGDVVSFDLPDPVAYASPAGVGGGGGGAGGISNVTGGGGGRGGVSRGPNLLDGHRLSLRVRLVPVK